MTWEMCYSWTAPQTWHTGWENMSAVVSSSISGAVFGLSNRFRSSISCSSCYVVSAANFTVNWFVIYLFSFFVSSWLLVTVFSWFLRCPLPCLPPQPPHPTMQQVSPGVPIQTTIKAYFKVQSLTLKSLWSVYYYIKSFHVHACVEDTMSAF